MPAYPTLAATAAASALTGMLLAFGPAGHAQTPRSYFSAAQATRGLILFNDNCAQCHRPDLTGAMGPALIGPAFLAKWSGQPLDNLYSYEHTTMPATTPGGLPDSTLLPITAYILQRNGYPAGPDDLATGDLGEMLPKPAN